MGVRDEYNRLLDMIRASNEKVNRLVIRHNNGEIMENIFWNELEEENKKSREIRNKLVSVRRELIIEEMGMKKW